MVQLIDLFDEGDCQTYNSSVARKFGSVSAAIMLSELVNRYKYHRSLGELRELPGKEGLWFYYTLEKCEERTVFKRKAQDNAIKIIEKHGLFSKFSYGMPQKRHFRINISKTEAFIKTFGDGEVASV